MGRALEVAQADDAELTLDSELTELTRFIEFGGVSSLAVDCDAVAMTSLSLIKLGLWGRWADGRDKPLERLAGTVMETGTLSSLLAMALGKLDRRSREEILRILEDVGELPLALDSSKAGAMNMMGINV